MEQPCQQQNYRTGDKVGAGMRRIRLAGIGLCALWCLLSCGLEEVFYIDYIPEGDYFDTRATILLPPSTAEGYGGNNAYFDNFIIFYRIYISDSNASTGTHLKNSQEARNDISTALNSDYMSLHTLTDTTSTTVSTANLENSFLNKQYFLLALEEANINRVLGSDALGGELEIRFPPNDMPALILNGTSYVLWRAIEVRGSTFSPKPAGNRYFLNYPELYDTANATKEINADVAPNTKANAQYTYVSLYIAAAGKTTVLPPQDVYSQPTFIGIFRLAGSM
jgi:hypothetical protein